MRASLMRWHRRVGLAAAVPVVLAVVTGLLINHTDTLGLARQHIRTPWILQWWGLQPPRLLVAYQQAGQAGHAGAWVSQWGIELFLDARPLRAPAVDALVGVASRGDDLWIAADTRHLLLLAPDGSLVDQLAYPSGFVAARLGRAESAPEFVVEDARGRQLWLDAQATALQPRELAPGMLVRWSAPGELPADLRARIEPVASPAELSVERVVLDLHSGRWLGRAGVWLMDAAAVVLVLLACTGAWTVWRRRGTARPEGEP